MLPTHDCVIVLTKISIHACKGTVYRVHTRYTLHNQTCTCDSYPKLSLNYTNNFSIATVTMHDPSNPFPGHSIDKQYTL